MIVRRTSREAYEQIKSEGLLARMNMAIYEYLFHYGPLTSREVLAGVKGICRDVGVVSSRLSALTRMEVVFERGTKKCSVTGREVIVFDVTDKLPRPDPMASKEKKLPCPHCDGTGYYQAPESKEENVRKFKAPEPTWKDSLFE